MIKSFEIDKGELLDIKLFNTLEKICIKKLMLYLNILIDYETENIKILS